MQLTTQYPLSFIELDEEFSGHFANQYTTAREHWYGVTGAPTVYFDGGNDIVGSYGSCGSNYSAYLSTYNSIMQSDNGLSPVSIAGTFTINGSTANLSATFTLVDSYNVGSVQATFFLYENNIIYCCDPKGHSIWQRIVRVIDSKPITTLIDQGDVATATSTMTIDPTWVSSNLQACVVLEHPTKGIIQSSMLPPYDLLLNLTQKVASAPNGNATITFPASVWNFSTVNDPVTITVDQGAGWPTDFQVQGDPTWYTSHTVTMTGNQTLPLTIRIQTDVTKKIGTAGITATSGNSGYMTADSVQVFNMGPAILFVDDDNGATYQGYGFDQPFRDALDKLGYLYTWWDISNGHGGAAPLFADENGYDAIVWQTAYQQSSFLGDAQTSGLETFMDNGGRLYLDSMDYLTVAGSPNAFTAYLGLTSWTNNTKASSEIGIPGDPISDGLNLPLNWPTPGANRTDTLVPGATAAGILKSDTGYINAVRNQVNTKARVVFSTVPQNVFSTTDPDPNNNAAVMGRIMTWILNTDITAAPEQAAGRSSILRINPNPLGGQTQLSFQLSPQQRADQSISFWPMPPGGSSGT